MAKVLIADDHDALREGMAVSLKKIGHDAAAVRSGADALAAYKKSAFDFVVTDLKMEGMDGIEVLKQLRAHDPDVVVMVVTAFGTVETAVEAMQLGAFDFIQKPFAPEVLRAKVEKGLELAATRRQVQRLLAHNEALAADAAAQMGSLVGTSEPMQRLVGLVRKAAATDTTVLVTGESGTGKELVARMIHELSPRKDGPFIMVNCAALAETLLESELFGHERGSFTGAVKRKLGRFELADGGTLFLDEIGDISPAMQTKLLRVLQEKEFQRVGGEETVKVDVRVVSATNREPQGGGRQGPLPRGPLLPAAHRPVAPAAAARAPGRHPPAGAALHRQAAGRVNPRVKGLTDAALRALCALRLAGQRARAGERHRAGAGLRRRRDARRARPAAVPPGSGHPGGPGSRGAPPARREPVPARHPRGPGARSSSAGPTRRPRA